MIKRINKSPFYCRVNNRFSNAKYNISWEYLKYCTRILILRVCDIRNPQHNLAVGVRFGGGRVNAFF